MDYIITTQEADVIVKEVGVYSGTDCGSFNYGVYNYGKRKINENKKSINKKLEEETIIINQQIREVDERCRQTEWEVQEVKEVVNTKITKIEEHHKKKLEENRKETQEELSKVRNQVTERCDGMEVAMTNITGQVRQSQEEMEEMCIRDSYKIYPRETY